MDFWLSIQLLVNLIVIMAVVFYMNRLRAENQLRIDDQKRIRQLSELRNSLDELMMQAGQTSERLVMEMDQKKAQARALLAEFEQAKKELIQLVQSLQNKEVRGPEPEESLNEGLPDKYAEAIKLAKSGLNAEEISRRTNIPLGEIELALSLRKP